MTRHAWYLRCRTEADYLHWCRNNGFSGSLNKSEQQRRNEQQCFINKNILEKLKTHNRQKNRARQIQDVYEKNLDFINTDDTFSMILHAGFRKSREPEFLLESLLYLESISDLLEGADYIKGVIRLCEYRQQWYQTLHGWQAKSHNQKRQFSDLLRFLLAKYPVPLFMDEAWRNDNSLHQSWFMHIGKGNNIRTAQKLPVLLTKKMAHYFIKAPDRCTIRGALRWAQVLALGGDQRTAEAVLATRLSTSFKDEDFWLSVLRFLINSPMLDIEQINPIVDYIWHQRFENQEVHLENGGIQLIEPAQPNMTMHGRTVASLLRQVHQWHRQLGRETQGGELQWGQSKINGFVFQEGQERKNSSKTWRIRELRSSKELNTEGRAMQHCVASYARSCHAGRTSIWTLELQEKTEVAKMLTLEVAQSTKLIVQARGLRNRVATTKELNIIRRWALQESLQFGAYI